MKFDKAFFKTITIAAGLLLASCSLTSNEKPAAIYVLHPRVDSAPLEVASPAVIEVPTPDVPAGFDTDQIALYWDQGRRLDYYAGARWPAPLNRLLQDFIVQSAHHALAGVAVAPPDVALTPDRRLMVKFIEFQPVYKGGPSGVPDLYVSVKFTTISTPDEKVHDDFIIADHAVAASDSLSAITAGLESLTQKILAQAFERIAPEVHSSQHVTTASGVRRGVRNQE